MTGLAASNKTYDGTTADALTGTPALLAAETGGSGTASDGAPYAGDAVTLAGTAAGAFAGKNAGSNISVTVSGNTLSGGQAGDYRLAANEESGLTANIAPYAITVTAATNSKTYDGTTTAAATPAITSGALQGTDTANFTETYGAKDVGTGLTLTPSGTVNDGNSGNNYAYTFVAVTTGTITPKALTYSGLSVPGSKVYDGTTNAVVSGTAALKATEAAGAGSSSDGSPYSGDDVSLTDPATAAYNSQDVAGATTVTFGGLSLTGAQVGDYTLTASTQSATITAKTLVVSGLAASDKIYDGTTTDTLTGTPALLTAETAGSGTAADGTPYSGDTVTLAGTAVGTFAEDNVASGTSVAVSGNTLSGAQAGDYVLAANEQSGLTASITPRAITVTAAANSKTYDGTTGAAATPTITSGSLASGDTANFTEVYSGKDVGTGLTLTPSGTVNDDNGGNNYAYTFVAATTGTITPKALTYSGLSVPGSKVYDGTTNAVVSGTAALKATEAAGAGSTSDGKPYSGDNVSLTDPATAAYNSKDVGSATTVTFGGLSLTGAQVGDYTLTTLTQAATVTAKTLTVNGLSANNKTYDATTADTLTGTPALLTAEAAGSGTSGDGTPYTGDTVTLGGTAAGTFASKNVASGISVTVSGNTLSGAQAGDYVLAANEQGGLSANITVKTLSVSGLAASNKTYNATTADTLTGTAALLTAETAGGGSTSDGKPYTGDTVTLGGTAAGTFASKDAASGIGVTVSGNTLSGAQAGNYALAANEESGLSANITAKTLTVSGLAASNKIYDATTTATLTGTAALLTAEAAGSGTTSDGTSYTGDTVILGGTAAGTFASKNVASGTSVTVSGNTLSGAQAGDYVLAANEQSGLTANITVKTLTVSGLAASNKTYNATTADTLTGTAALLTAETAGSGSTSDGSPVRGRHGDHGGDGGGDLRLQGRGRRHQRDGQREYPQRGPGGQLRAGRQRRERVDRQHHGQDAHGERA